MWITHTFAHRNPFDFVFAFAHDLLSNLEFFGLIDDSFDPKNETGFVVHFLASSL